MVQQLASRPQVDLGKIFTPNCVVVLEQGTAKSEVLRSLISVLAAAGRIPLFSRDNLTREALHRERLATTGIGNGIALPHLRSKHVENFVGAVGVAPDGIDFHALDGLPTLLVVMLISPLEKRVEQFAVMARVASLLSNKTLPYSLRRNRTPEELLSFLGFRD